MRLLLLLALALSAPAALAQTPNAPRPLSEAPRSAQLSGFSFDAPDEWRIMRSQGGARPMVMLEQVPIGDPEVNALVISIPTWTDPREAGEFVALRYGLIPLDEDWLSPTAEDGTLVLDSAVVRAFRPPPDAPVAATAVLAVEARGRVAVVFLSTAEAWAPERLRETAVVVASGLRRTPDAAE